jgi:hypothetical protein
MKRAILCSVVAVGLCCPVADAAKKKKKESEVTKTLKEQYPDAETQITNSQEINGVRVYDVTIKNKSGESTAQITDYGDFLMYGVPHEYGVVKNLISSNVSGLFKSAPDDIDMYRVTTYTVEFPGAKGKTYAAQFDALGRLTDIKNASELQRESGKEAHGAKASDDQAKKAEAQVKKYSPEAQVQGVFQSEQGGDFLYVQTNGGEWIVNPAGQVYGFREEIKLEDLPDPVEAAVKNTFSGQASKAYRGEYEYYQFNQQTQTGDPIVVKMRPNGDILEVINTKAEQETQALQAKAKQSKSAAKKSG